MAPRVGDGHPAASTRSWWTGAGLDGELTDHYAPQQQFMPIMTNISGAVHGYVVDISQSLDEINTIGLSEVVGFSPSENASDSADELLMPLWAYHTAAVYLLFISVLGLVMNIVVVIVIINDPQKTPLNWMLLNLACSDGTIAGFGTPVSTAAALQSGWHFSHELCVAYAMIMSTAGIGSITTLTALALWRCTLVVYCPAKRSSAFNSSSSQLGRGKAALLLALIWTYTLAVTCPPLFGWGRYDREAAHISCSVNWESKMDNNRSYILYMFAMGLIIPLIAIVVSYTSILRVVRKTSEIKRKTLTTLQSNLAGQSMVSDQRHHVNNNNHQQTHSDAAEKRVTVMVACMIAAFMTAWTPYSILALVETFSGFGPSPESSTTTSQSGENFIGNISPALATIPSLFAKTSAVLNPLIYGLLNTQFRSAWERFSLRFLGRRRRHHHHHHHHHRHHRHHNNNHNNSQEIVANTSGDRRQLRRLLECHRNLQTSPTVQLPMKEILPASSSIYAMATPQGTEVAIQSATERELALNGQQQQHQQPPPNESEEKAKTSSKTPPSPSTSTSSSSSSPSSLTDGEKTETNLIQLQQQQPVSLVVVRLLSDSTSCCTDELVDELSVVETSVDASSGGFNRPSTAGQQLTRSSKSVPVGASFRDVHSTNRLSSWSLNRNNQSTFQTTTYHNGSTAMYK